ncbi:MAG: OmpA family protein [Bacteroidota bacterium]
MRKYTTLVLLLFAATQLSSQSSDLLVQVAAFDRQVSLDYFRGLDDVFHMEDHNGIHKYFIGDFDSEAAAEQQVASAKKLGYNAYLLDMEKIRAHCSSQCGAPLIDPTTIRPIFFDFDQSFLRSESKYQLGRLHKLLEQNPTYTAELMAHTDAKGSIEYNVALSKRRAQSAKDFLVAKGIATDRLKMSNFGEDTPIAINATTKGTDSPQGRQLNRRVELLVRDASGKVLNVVEEIVVPDVLKL